MSDSKRRVYISDHGTFTLFDMRVPLPAIMELTESQIDYIKKSGIYKISELSAAQTLKAKPTAFSDIEGDRFESARTKSVNELAFKKPILGTKFAEKAKNAVIVKKSSVYGKKLQKSDNELTKKEVPSIPVKAANTNSSTNTTAVITRKSNKVVNNKLSTLEADLNNSSTTSTSTDNIQKEVGESK